ncbi:MAG: hypothetical protein ACLSA6_10240 [Holdemania massiliensis]
MKWNKGENAVFLEQKLALTNFEEEQNMGIKIALAGNPNSGNNTFNALTKSVCGQLAGRDG